MSRASVLAWNGEEDFQDFMSQVQLEKESQVRQDVAVRKLRMDLEKAIEGMAVTEEADIPEDNAEDGGGNNASPVGVGTDGE
jgi:hypothetical protein